MKYKPKCVKYADDRFPVETGCSKHDNCFTCPLPECKGSQAEITRTVKRTDLKREKLIEDVIRMLSDGMKPRIVAAELGIPRHSVDYYRRIHEDRGTA